MLDDLRRSKKNGAMNSKTTHVIIFASLCALLVGPMRRVSAETVDDLLARIHWLSSAHPYGSACVRIDGPPVVYLDPAALPESARRIKADVILVTHNHPDHFSPETIGLLARPQTHVVTIPACASALRETETARDLKIFEIRPGERLNAADLEIEAVPAYNLSGEVHPRSAGGVGFVITLGGARIYHSGDTSVTDEMRALRDIDIALLTLRPTYMMSGSEIVEAANAFGPKVLIPIHWLDAERPEIDHIKKHISKSVRLVVLDAK
jgi:L-ascorbate metabolism protein UlaG (beta-lactamase superfamily)